MISARSDEAYVRRYVRLQKWGDRMRLFRRKPCGCTFWLWGRQWLWCLAHIKESLNLSTDGQSEDAS